MESYHICIYLPYPSKRLSLTCILWGEGVGSVVEGLLLEEDGGLVDGKGNKRDI